MSLHIKERERLVQDFLKNATKSLKYYFYGTFFQSFVIIIIIIIENVNDVISYKILIVGSI